MRVLLDTHAFLWWLAGDRKLKASVRRIVDDPTTVVFVSAASVWEIATKVRLGQLPGAASIADDIGGAIASQKFEPLGVSVAHAQRAGGLAIPHRDPFDRMLIAQSQLENVPLVSNEKLFDHFGVTRIW